MRSPKCRDLAVRVHLSVLTLICLVWGLPNPAQARDRALLVGLERYADPRVNPTPGGNEDARSLAVILEQQLGFAAHDIRLLLDDAATSKAIIDSFEDWLIEGSEPGDRVFFLYAGHGSQLADQNGDEEDGFDETLAPFDVDPTTGAGQIRDDQLDGLIAQLTGRRAVLLFDSCHSGTLTRGVRRDGGEAGNSGVRFLPRPEQWASLGALRRGASETSGGYDVQALEGSDAGAFDAPDRLGRMAGIVAISAAGPGQLAFPVEVAGKPRGALSYLFEEAVSLGHRGLLDTMKSQVEKTAGSALGNLASDAVQERFEGRPSQRRPEQRRPGQRRPEQRRPEQRRPEQRRPSGQQSVTISGLELSIESGMQRLQSSGRLPGQQQPWFEVISETPIAEQPLFGDWQQAASLAMSNPVDSRQVSLRTRGDRVLYHRGEAIVFQVSTDRPGFLYLLVFSEEEKATCLFPNPADPDNRVGQGTIEVPSHEGYRLPVRAPFGRDLVVALVSDQPLPLCQTIDTTWSEIFARVQLDEIHQRLRTQVRRGIGVAATGASAPKPETDEPALPSWQTDEWVIHTMATGVAED